MSIQKSLVLGGHGFTILPPIAFANELGTKLLTAAPLCDPEISRTIVLALPTNRVVENHVQRTVELIIQCTEDAVHQGEWLEAK